MAFVHPVDPLGAPIRRRLAQLGTASPKATAGPILNQPSKRRD